MALGAASSIFGGAKAASAARAARRERKREQGKQEAWYSRRYNEDYADTAAGQQLITKAQDYARDNFQRAQGAQAVGGSTTAQTAAAKEAGNKVVGSTLSNLAAQDTARKEQIDAQHQRYSAAASEQNAQAEENRGAQINAAATLAGNQLIQAGAGLLQDGAKGAKKPAANPGTPSSSPARPIPVPDTTSIDDLLPERGHARHLGA